MLALETSSSTTREARMTKCQTCGQRLPKMRDINAFESKNELQVRRRNGKLEQRFRWKLYWDMDKRRWCRGKWPKWSPVEMVK